MKKRTVAFCCFVLAGAILSASRANATVYSAILLPAGNSNGTVTGAPIQHFEAFVCDGLTQPGYAQRMVLAGVSMWFLVDFEYAPGPKTLVLVGTCNDGTSIYELYDCPCDHTPGDAELAQLASPDRLNIKTNTLRAEYRSPLRRDEPEGNAPVPSSALAGEDWRRHLRRSLFTLRG